MVLINEQEEILYSMYQPNQGNALQLVREALIELMRANPRMDIVSSCVTGYGEDLIRSAFGVGNAKNAGDPAFLLLQLQNIIGFAGFRLRSFTGRLAQRQRADAAQVLAQTPFF